MKEPAPNSQLSKGDIFTVFVAILGLAISFVNIYKFAHRAEPGNTVWAGVALVAFTMLLSTQLAKMRKS